MQSLTTRVFFSRLGAFARTARPHAAPPAASQSGPEHCSPRRALSLSHAPPPALALILSCPCPVTIFLRCADSATDHAFTTTARFSLEHHRLSPTTPRKSFSLAIFPHTPTPDADKMADKTFTYSDVSAHSTKKDLYIVVHDKVYNASSFVDEHPYVIPPFPFPLHISRARRKKGQMPRSSRDPPSPAPHRSAVPQHFSHPPNAFPEQTLSARA